jgi:toxin ParE1/3/4
MRLRLSPLIPVDLEQISDYIAQDSPAHALRMLRLLRSQMNEIAKHPEMYRLRPEIGTEARLATVGNYVILFRICKSEVRIERVLQGNRDLSSMLDNVGSQGSE